MSFASEPGRDDGNLPPVNVVIPDDARDLDRDVLAYRRELRANRRRQRFLRLFQPFRAPELGGHAVVIPLIAICLAICLVGGALLSVATMSPASAPTLRAQGTVPAGELTALPAGSVLVGWRTVPVRLLTSSVIALVPANCDCGLGLQRLAGQAADTHATLYFAAGGAEQAQLDALTARYGEGVATAAADYDSVLTTVYHPDSLTVLLIYKDGTAEVFRNLAADFQLTSLLRDLGQPAPSATAGKSATS